MEKISKDNQHSANQGVLKAINDLSKKTDERFEEVLEVVNVFADKTENRFNKIDGEISGMKGEISDMKGEICSIKARMVTKDYLDDKMSDLRGDLVVMMRKEDTKLKTLVGVLADKKVLDGSDVKRIYALEPFGQ